MSAGEDRICKNCTASFQIDVSDFDFYKKMGVPAPAICPQCRFLRRCLFRNETTLYNHSCARCEKSVISMYHPNSRYTVYCHSCWDSDEWDPFSYAMEYDSSRPFFEQLGELFQKVPKKATYTSSGAGPNINSEYTNVAGGNKNCYLVFNTGQCEDTMYSRGLRGCRDTVDSYYGNNLEKCYEAVNVQESSGVIFGQNVTGSMDSWFLLNCSGCKDCFGCVNLRNKTNHFFNIPLTKEDYQTKLKEVMGSYTQMVNARKKFEELVMKSPQRENNNIKSVNCFGNYIFESKNVSHSYEMSNCEDCKYGLSNKLAKDCYDFLGYGFSSELLLECVAVGYSQRVIGSYGVDVSSRDMEYSFMMRTGKNCFGCDAIKNAEFCILNKKYSEEEYNRLRGVIVEDLKSTGEYGLFFPPSIAPFAYNETIAQDNFPITKEQALARGFGWQDDVQMTVGKETMKSESIPDNINDVSESITKEVFVCVECGRNYRIIQSEFEFYKKLSIPIPRRCFYCRHRDRVRRRGPIMLFDRVCSKCNKDIKTTFSPEREDIVYCESCYQSEVI